MVLGKRGADYVQVKSSRKPARPNRVIIGGSPWTAQQINEGAPRFNKHDGFLQTIILIVDSSTAGETHYFLASPEELERLARPLARAFADKPKRDGAARSIGFRKELPIESVERWRNSWGLLGEPFLDPKS